MTRREAYLINLDADRTYEKLLNKRDSGDEDLVGMTDEELAIMAYDEAENNYEEAMDSKMEQAKEDKWL